MSSVDMVRDKLCVAPAGEIACPFPCLHTPTAWKSAPYLAKQTQGQFTFSKRRASPVHFNKADRYSSPSFVAHANGGQAPSYLLHTNANMNNKFIVWALEKSSNLTVPYTGPAQVCPYPGAGHDMVCHSAAAAGQHCHRKTHTAPERGPRLRLAAPGGLAPPARGDRASQQHLATPAKTLPGSRREEVPGSESTIQNAQNTTHNRDSHVQSATT